MFKIASGKWLQGTLLKYFFRAQPEKENKIGNISLQEWQFTKSFSLIIHRQVFRKMRRTKQTLVHGLMSGYWVEVKSLFSFY